MIDNELRDYLLADSTLVALLGSASAFYPVRLPQGGSKPCIVYSVHDGIAKLNHGSVSPVRRYSVTLRVVSESYGDSRLIAERIRVLLTGLSTTLSSTKVVSAQIHNVLADYNLDSEYYSSIIDTTIYIRD